MAFIKTEMFIYHSSFNTNALSNKSLDVRAKQLLCYLACLFSLTLRVAVSPHVNSIVRQLSSGLSYEFWSAAEAVLKAYSFI